MGTTPRLFDLVAVLSGSNDEGILVGDVGTVVEILPPDGFEVEFLNRDGKTRCVAAFAREDLLALNRERTPVA